MELAIELPLNTSLSHFEQWLAQYLPDSIPDYIDWSEEEKPIQYVGIPILTDKNERMRYDARLFLVWRNGPGR